MDKSVLWCLALFLAASGCAGVRTDRKHCLGRAELVNLMGGEPTRLAAVGADHRLLEWRFTQTWPELEASQVRVLALEGARGEILWWLRDPPGWPSLPGHGGYVSDLWALLDEEWTAAEREWDLRTLGLLDDGGPGS